MRNRYKLVFRAQLKIDLILACESKITFFSVSVDIGLVFVTVVKTDLTSVWGLDLTKCQCRDQIDLVVLWVVELDLLLVRMLPENHLLLVR